MIIYVGMILLVIGLTGWFGIPVQFPAFITRESVLGVAAGLLVIGTTEMWIHAEQPELQGFAGNRVWKRRPTKFSWFMEGMGILAILISLMDMITRLLSLKLF